MKLFNRVLIVAAFGIISQTCFAQQSGYKITVKAPGITDTIAYLGHHFGDQRFLKDTAQISNNGIVVFDGDETLGEGIYFFYTGQQYFEFLVSEQEFDVVASGPVYAENLEFVGSDNNRIFLDLQEITSKSRKQVELLTKKIESASDDESKQALQDSIQMIDLAMKENHLQIIDEFPDMYVSQLVKLFWKPQPPDSIANEDKFNYFHSHFFDKTDIANPGLLRSPLLLQKILEYLDEATYKNPDSIISAVDYVLGAASNNEEVLRFMLVKLANKYETSPFMGMDKVFVHIVETYYLGGELPWADAKMLDGLRNRIATMKPNFIGNQAPKITLWDSIQTEVTLYDIDARFTVLYFFDPDCGHCKEKTPILYDAYPSLQAKGVEVMAICGTTDARRWREYITENDFSEWINVIDEQSRSNMKYYYDVRSYPTIYILDKNKKILAKRLDAADVENLIDMFIENESLDN